jgi:thiol-disulfide isomerase/thioredoxin
MSAILWTCQVAGLALLVGWISPISVLAQNTDPANPATDPATAEDGSELSEVEYLLELRDAERNWDMIMSSAIRPESTRLRPSFDPAKVQPLLESSQVLLAKMDAILASPRIPPIRKDQVRFKKLSFLYDAVKINAEAFKPSRDALIAELYAQAQREEGEEQRLAALLAGYKLREDFIDSDKPIEKIQAALDEFQSAYPRSGIILSLYFRRAENLEEAGDIKGATEMLRKLQLEFPADPRLALLDSRIKRLEMIGQPAELAGPTLDGSEFNLADNAGKVVLVDFWASWCRPCLDSFTTLDRLRRKYQDKGLVIVGITLDDKVDDVKEALDRNPAAWPNIFFEPKEGEGRGFEGPLATRFHINYIPARFLIGKDGKFLGTNYPRVDVLELQIAKALGLEGMLPELPEPAPTTPGTDVPATGEPLPEDPAPSPATDPVLDDPSK